MKQLQQFHWLCISKEWNLANQGGFIILFCYVAGSAPEIFVDVHWGEWRVTDIEKKLSLNYISKRCKLFSFNMFVARVDLLLAWLVTRWKMQVLPCDVHFLDRSFSLTRPKLRLACSTVESYICELYRQKLILCIDFFHQAIFLL